MHLTALLANRLRRQPGGRDELAHQRPYVHGAAAADVDQRVGAGNPGRSDHGVHGVPDIDVVMPGIGDRQLDAGGRVGAAEPDRQGPEETLQRRVRPQGVGQPQDHGVEGTVPGGVETIREAVSFALA